MVSPVRNEFLTAREWHNAVVGGRDLILRRTSALEYLQLFGGYIGEKRIDVYAKRPGEFDNINYCVVGTFDGIEFSRLGGVLCATVNQTFNEMLSDYENIDEQSLIEGLAGYYFSHGESFDGLYIAPENRRRFDEIKEWAAEYYDEV
ncbi:hypothetical protein FACS189490_03880 [Clostridia bacterium]|nr:hypothetical protein FACS189490_03880 [Clostridia bacterium]